MTHKQKLEKAAELLEWAAEKSELSGGVYDVAYRYAAAFLREQAGANRRLWVFWTDGNGHQLVVRTSKTVAQLTRSNLRDSGYSVGPLRSVPVVIDKPKRKARK